MEWQRDISRTDLTIRQITGDWDVMAVWRCCKAECAVKGDEITLICHVALDLVWIRTLSSSAGISQAAQSVHQPLRSQIRTIPVTDYDI